MLKILLDISARSPESLSKEKNVRVRKAVVYVFKEFSTNKAA